MGFPTPQTTRPSSFTPAGGFRVRGHHGIGGLKHTKTPHSNVHVCSAKLTTIPNRASSTIISESIMSSPIKDESPTLAQDDTVPQNDKNSEPEKRPIAAVDIAPYGDLILEVDTPAGLARFRVVSAALCLSSPVFRAMLGPNSNFKEACELRKSKSAEPHVISLDDDYPQALAVVLHALHLRNDKVPQKITFDNLYELAVICDKYDCAAAMSLWISIWIKQWNSLSLDPGYERWLFIAWAFGIEDVFTKLSKKIIMEGHFTKKDGRLLNGQGLVALDPNVPDSVVQKILQRRSSIVRSMPQHVLAFLPRYNTPGMNSRCRAPVPLDQCDMMILGSTLKEFQSLGILPTYEELLLKSINDLYSSLKGIKIHFWQAPRGGPCKPHSVDPARCRHHSDATVCSTAIVSHEGTCSFVYELTKGLDAIVSKTKGLSLHESRSRQSYITPLTDGKWESMKYI